jgi:hypothetical protein
VELAGVLNVLAKKWETKKGIASAASAVIPIALTFPPSFAPLPPSPNFCCPVPTFTSRFFSSRQVDLLIRGETLLAKD